ncbi:MAG: PorV/PorQ family protein [Ignavibacteriae bacterium]|nr:PorV/PorQ family protein [Ignavibacteriota bacterium]MCB9242627.1 PorV/PorQ family protein [Ignavibacteriales bacterium]
MTNKISTIIILTACFFATNLFAQNDGAGNTGMAFLKLGVGAESMAMGEAYSSLSEDATAYVYNPARLSFGSPKNVSLMHNSSIQDLNNDFIAAKFNLGGRLTMGLGVVRSSVDNIEIRTTPGDPIGTFSAENLSIGISMGYKLSETFSIGLTTKWLYEKIYIDDATGVGFDIGASYQKNNFSLSGTIANLGSLDDLRNVPTNLPTLVRLGGGYRFSKKDFDFRIGVEGFKVMDGGSLHLHAGGEVGYKDFLFVRAGYQSGYENKNFTTGVGFKYKGIKLDYAFIPYSSEFGTSNAFSLGINFN